MNGKDLRNLALIERKQHLKRLVKQSKNPALLFANHGDQHGVELFCMVCEKNLEGIVAKHRDSRYDASAKWIKIKNTTYTQTERRHQLLKRFTSSAKGERKAG
jgi:bifunctional non-homologous end joining protein LigD